MAIWHDDNLAWRHKQFFFHALNKGNKLHTFFQRNKHSTFQFTKAWPTSFTYLLESYECRAVPIPIPFGRFGGHLNRLVPWCKRMIWREVDGAVFDNDMESTLSFIPPEHGQWHKECCHNITKSHWTGLYLSILSPLKSQTLCHLTFEISIIFCLKSYSRGFW